MALDALVMRGHLTTVGAMEEVTALDMEGILMVAMGSGNGSVSPKASTAKLIFFKSCNLTRLLTDPVLKCFLLQMQFLCNVDHSTHVVRIVNVYHYYYSSVLSYRGLMFVVLNSLFVIWRRFNLVSNWVICAVLYQ